MEAEEIARAREAADRARAEAARVARAAEDRDGPPAQGEQGAVPEQRDAAVTTARLAEEHERRARADREKAKELREVNSAVEDMLKGLTEAVKAIGWAAEMGKYDGRLFELTTSLEGYAARIGKVGEGLQDLDETAFNFVRAGARMFGFSGKASHHFADFLDKYAPQPRPLPGVAVPMLTAYAAAVKRDFLTVEVTADALTKVTQFLWVEPSPKENEARLARMRKYTKDGAVPDELAKFYFIRAAPSDISVGIKASATFKEAVDDMEYQWATRKKPDVRAEAKASAPKAAKTWREGSDRSNLASLPSGCFFCHATDGHWKKECQWLKHGFSAQEARDGVKAGKQPPSKNKGNEYLVSGNWRTRKDGAGKHVSLQSGARDPARGVRVPLSSPFPSVGPSRVFPVSLERPGSVLLQAGAAEAAGEGATPVSGRRYLVDVMLGYENGPTFSGLVDSGCSQSIIGAALLRDVGVEYLPRPGLKLELAAGKEAGVLGAARVWIHFGTRKALVELIVVEDGGLLLGADALDAIGVMRAVKDALESAGARVQEEGEGTGPTAVVGMVGTVVKGALQAAGAWPRELEKPVAAMAAAVGDGLEMKGATPQDPYATDADILAFIAARCKDISKHPHLLKDLREVLLENRRAFIKDDALPPACKSPPAKLEVVDHGQAIMKQRRRTPETRQALWEWEEDLIRYDIAAVRPEPTGVPYRAEPLLVWYADKPKPRVVLDYTLANPHLKDDVFPIPMMLDEVGKLYGGPTTVYSQFDVGSGYYVQLLDEESQKFTLWAGEHGTMVLKRLAMGLKTSPAIFCRLVHSLITSKLSPEVVRRFAAYVDDLAHASEAPTFEQAVCAEIGAIRIILRLAIESGITFRLGKCAFCVRSIVFCGFEIVAGKRRPAPKNLKGILEYGEFRTKTHVRSWLGMLTQVVGGVRGIAEMVQELRKVSKGTGPLAMTPKAKEDAERIKEAVARAPHLKIVEPGKAVELRVDASGTGAGWGLYQEGDLCKVSGRPFTERERLFWPGDRELLAILSALRDVESEIGGRHVEVLVKSDNEPLAGKPHTGPRIREHQRAAYMHEIHQYPRCKISYVPKGEQFLADAVSRSPAFAEPPQEDPNAGKDGRVATKTAPAGAVAEIARREVPFPLITRASAVSAPSSGPDAMLEATVPEVVRPDVWRGRQMRDDRTRWLIGYLEGGGLPADVSKQLALGIAAQAQYCEVVDGALYHKAERRLGRKGGPELLIQIYVPDVDDARKTLMARAHGSAPGKGETYVPEGAHEGGLKMWERLRADFFWDSMLDDCKRYAQRCFVCKERVNINHSFGLGEMTTSDEIGPHGRLWADAAGPFPMTARGNKYILIFVNERARVVVVAVADLETKTVIQAYKDHALKEFGVTSLFVTDRASNFNAELAVKVYEDLGLKKATTTSYHPETNGRAENGVKVVKAILAKLVSEYGGDWDLHLSQVEVRMVSWQSEPSGMSPFKAMTGRDMQLPSAFENPMHVTHSDVMEKMVEVDKVIKEARDEAAARMKEQYDKGRVDVRFKVGDKVWWRAHEPAALEPKRTGPYVVERVVSALDYELAELPQGPRVGRRHPVVNIKHIEAFDADAREEEQEEAVEAILKHRRRKTKVSYLVRWKDGDETWSRTRDLVDKEGDEFIILQALKDYWKKTPMLKKWEKLYEG